MFKSDIIIPSDLVDWFGDLATDFFMREDVIFSAMEIRDHLMRMLNVLWVANHRVYHWDYFKQEMERAVEQALVAHNGDVIFGGLECGDEINIPLLVIQNKTVNSKTQLFTCTIWMSTPLKNQVGELRHMLLDERKVF